jgi:hypothetical protein
VDAIRSVEQHDDDHRCHTVEGGALSRCHVVEEWIWD